VSRQEAHEILRQAAMRAYQNNTTLFEELVKDERVMKYFSEHELRDILRPENYLGTALERVERVVKWVREVVG
jgi:adenylosuccinate lyase